MEKGVSKKSPVKKTKKGVATKATTTKKVTPKSGDIKKTETKKVTVKKVTPPKETKVVDNTPKVNCKYCNEPMPNDLTVCPFCLRNQKDILGRIVIGSLVVILLLSIIFNHFVTKYYADKVSESDYKQSCKLVSYEDLVRNYREYKGEDIKIIGRIIKVEGADTGKSNKMTVQIDVNLFEGTGEQVVEFIFTDKDFEKGLLVDDIITVYGNYSSLNGNTPYIKAKYLFFGA